MTSKELLYEWACNMAEKKDRQPVFEKIEDGLETYFEEIENQPLLVKYDIKNRSDIEKYMERYFDDDLIGIKTVCTRAFLEGMSRVKAESEVKEKQRETGIREYIYNF